MFEQKLKKLEEIVKKMEAGDLELDQSLKLFEEGVKLTKDCQTHLQDAELKVKLLTGLDENGNAVTQAFKAQD
jgi:exodeoxyribonuclease VII small subunit